MLRTYAHAVTLCGGTNIESIQMDVLDAACVRTGEQHI